MNSGIQQLGGTEDEDHDEDVKNGNVSLVQLGAAADLSILRAVSTSPSLLNTTLQQWMRRGRIEHIIKLVETTPGAPSVLQQEPVATNDDDEIIMDQGVPHQQGGYSSVTDHSTSKSKRIHNTNECGVDDKNDDQNNDDKGEQDTEEGEGLNNNDADEEYLLWGPFPVEASWWLNHPADTADDADDAAYLSIASSISDNHQSKRLQDSIMGNSGFDHEKASTANHPNPTNAGEGTKDDSDQLTADVDTDTLTISNKKAATGMMVVTTERLIFWASDVKNEDCDLIVLAPSITLHAQLMDDNEEEENDHHADSYTGQPEQQRHYGVYVQIQMDDSDDGDGPSIELTCKLPAGATITTTEDDDDDDGNHNISISSSANQTNNYHLHQQIQCQELWEAFSRLIELNPIHPDEDNDPSYQGPWEGDIGLMMGMETNAQNTQVDDDDDGMIILGTHPTDRVSEIVTDEERQAMLDRFDEMLFVPSELEQMETDDEQFEDAD